MVRLFLLGVLVLLAPVPAHAGVSLAWKWRKGDKFFVEVRTVTRSQVKSEAEIDPATKPLWAPFQPIAGTGAQPTNEKVEQKVDAVLACTVLETDADGGVLLEVHFLSIEEASVGAATDAASNGMVQMLRNRAIRVALDRDMNVQRVEELEQIVKNSTQGLPKEASKWIDFMAHNVVRYWLQNSFCPVPARSGTECLHEISTAWMSLGHWRVLRTIRYERSEQEAGRPIHVLAVRGKARLTPPTWDTTIEPFRSESVELRRARYSGTIKFDAEAGRMKELKIAMNSTHRGQLAGGGARHKSEVDRSEEINVRLLERSPLPDKGMARKAQSPEELLRKEARKLPRHETNSLGQKLVLIPRGKFVMGSPPTEPNRAADEEQHEVELTRPFYLGQHEVTVGEYRKFVEATGYQTEAETHYFGGHGYDAKTKAYAIKAGYSWKNTGIEQTDRHPVVNVSWNDAIAFCEWLSKKEGKKYRLPTDAEWEWACRAGSTTRYHWGDDIRDAVKFANLGDDTLKKVFPDLSYVPGSDGFLFTAPAGSFRPNGFGLHDINGNVSEWCSNWTEVPTNKALKDPQGPESGTHRVHRGSDWTGAPVDARAARRFTYQPLCCFLNVGFRVVLDGP